MLKLVHNAEPIPPQPLQQVAQLPDDPLELTPFKSTVHFKSPNLYVMQISDFSHYLTCDLVLEVNNENTENGLNVVICHIPTIVDEQLNTFIWEDDTLYAITMIQFQMKILKELLQFCINQYAFKLVLFLDKEQAEDFGIYKEFLDNDDGEEFIDNFAKMTISVNTEMFEDWIDFMNQATLRFQQTLWQNQRTPAVRHYLTSHPFTEGY